jgi:hypothetical protein
MIDCCVKNFEVMHEITDSFWWFQRFVFASPFVLVLPDLDPTMGSKELVELGLDLTKRLTYDEALGKIQKNRGLPDFADTVKNIGSMSYNELRRQAQSHANFHIYRISATEKKIGNFWINIVGAYDQAFSSK